MLYDNALLVPAYLHAWVVTGEERYRQVVEETCEYLLRDLALPGRRVRLFTGRRYRRRRGADLHLDTGRRRTRGAARAVRARPLDHPRRARPGAAGVACSRSARSARSRRATTRRSPPGTGSPSRRSRRPGGVCRAATLLQAAMRLGDFLLDELSTPDGRLFRTWRNGRASIPGYLEDYADVAHGLIELHVATGDLRWLEEANRLARLAVELFADETRGGFFMTAHDAEQLVARKKDLDDNPVPSGNSMLAYVLLRLSRIYGDDELERHAVGVLRLVHTALGRVPSAFGWALCALDLYLSPPRELAIIGIAGATRSRARRSPRSSRTPWSRSGRAKTCRCSRGRHGSTASRRSTSASASPARRPSRTRHRSRSRRLRAWSRRARNAPRRTRRGRALARGRR